MEDLTRLMVWVGSLMVFIAIFLTKPFANILESPVLIAVLMILLAVYILFFAVEYNFTKKHISKIKQKYFDFSGNFLSLVILVLLLFILEMPWYYVLLIISSFIIILTVYNFERQNHH